MRLVITRYGLDRGQSRHSFEDDRDSSGGQVSDKEDSRKHDQDLPLSFSIKNRTLQSIVGALPKLTLAEELLISKLNVVPRRPLPSSALATEYISGHP